MTTALRVALPLILCLVASCRAPGPQPPAPVNAATISARHAMVVAANPLAAQAGLDVLRGGGSAADAAVAVQAVLGLVEPQSSGLGGGTFITFYDARTRTVTAYNGRETAPAGATADMFLGAGGQPLSYPTAVLSGRATGVPGAVAALGLLQRDHGALPWSDLFGRAAQLAEDGFVVSPRLAGWIDSGAPQTTAPDVVRYFTKPDGTRVTAGDLLLNPAYAATVRELAAKGPGALYQGRLAADIVRRVHEAPLPGSLALEDLARYRAVASPALCHAWQATTVCVPPLPSGGASVLEGLLLLDQTDIGSRGPGDALAWVRLGEAERLLYADRNRYVGDPDFVAVPLAGLLDPAYIRARAALIGDRAAATAPPAGVPPGAPARGPDHTLEPGGTSSLVIVDEAGNVVCMTTTVESIFGSGRMVDGFFLNNQLTDFSFSPRDPDGQPAANAVAPFKRPRSAMAPTIVLDGQGRFLEAVGSAGGPAIISYVLKTLIATHDWGLSMSDAVSLPNLVARGNSFSAEVAKFDPALVTALQARGLDVHLGQYEESGLHGVAVGPHGELSGGADPRREGVALSY
jgi:gamma-glutamyltranspeptidase/glutathione hydrolase